VNYWWKPPDWRSTVEAEKKFKFQLLSAMKQRLEETRVGEATGDKAKAGKEEL
jgi:hypothetical protein